MSERVKPRRKYKPRKEGYTVSPYVPPDFAVRLGESRMEPFVAAYQRGQRFSGMLAAISHVPHPTLLDLAVSAYLQGIEDTVQSCTKNGFDFGGEGEHLRRRDQEVRIGGGDAEGAESANASLEGIRPQPTDGDAAPSTGRGGPHAPEQEFGLPLW